MGIQQFLGTRAFFNFGLLDRCWGAAAKGVKENMYFVFDLMNLFGALFRLLLMGAKLRRGGVQVVVGDTSIYIVDNNSE